MNVMFGNPLDWIFLVLTLLVLFFVLRKASREVLTRRQSTTITLIEMLSLYILVWLTLISLPDLNIPRTLIFVSLFLGLGYADKLQLKQRLNKAE